MNAILLAAGEGSRLRPYTVHKPKPMVRAANKPILQHAIEALVANGIRDITLVVGYHRERVQSYFGDGKRVGARISYAFQATLGGTAQALAHAARPDGPFLALSGDNVVDADLIKSVISLPPGKPAVVVHQSDRPQRYGVVMVDGDRLTRIVEKPSDPLSEWVNTGVYAFPPEFHDRARALAQTSGAGLPDVLQSALADGVRIAAVKSDALWADAVYPWDLLWMHAALLRRAESRPQLAHGVHAEPPVLVGADNVIGPGTTLGAGTCIGDNVVIGPNCVLENCVVYDDVQIGPGSVLRNTIVGAGTRIGARFTALSGPADVRLTDGWHHLTDFGAVLGEDCQIGGTVTILPGGMVGNHVTIAHGRQVLGNVGDRSHVL